MGKSEIVPMPPSIHRQESDNRSLYADCRHNKTTATFKMTDTAVHTVSEESPRDGTIPEDVEMFNNQVAGHTDDGKSIGMLKRTIDGAVLKPMTNPRCGEREVEFYERLAISQDRDLLELRDLVPKYFGKITVPIRGKNVDCISLEDLTQHFQEPCVMDIKIGKRTWDPEASFQKILKEDTKYRDCKNEMAFCIPGFQVYKISNGQLVKYDKAYGKKLNKDTIPQAMKTFLNADGPGFCRSLLVQFLAVLWRIQIWARKQRHVHLYSSSLLLVYDARSLKNAMKLDDKPKAKLNRSTSLYRPLSLAVLNGCNEKVKVKTGFSGQLTKDGPILRQPPKLKKDFEIINNKTTSGNCNNVWHKSMRILKRTHSFQNNYDKDLQHKKQDYSSMLDDLCTSSAEQKSELWATAKMIDFAHAFPAENHEIDRNYLEGIDNLIKLFEKFLVESE